MEMAVTESGGTFGLTASIKCTVVYEGKLLSDERREEGC